MPPHLAASVAAHPRPTLATRLQVALIADDVTGAADAAVAFAGRGLVSELALTPDAQPGPACQVWAVCTHTRDVEKHQLAQSLADEFARMPPAALLYKKIDSVFRGNTLAEIAAMPSLHPGRLCVLAPAFPAVGRTTRHGMQHVVDQANQRAIPIAQELHRRGAHLSVLPCGLTEEATRLHLHEAHLGSILLGEAETQQDLERLVAAAHSLDRPLLWIGSGGLAAALAAGTQGGLNEPVGASTLTTGSVVFFIGSDHPVTLAQVAALEAHTRPGAPHLDSEMWEGLPQTHVQVHPTPSQASMRLLTIRRSHTTEPEIRNSVADLSPETTGALFMTGGDTAATVCRALDISSLILKREFAPGLPLAHARGGRFDGVPVLLKSGGFGEQDILCRILATFAPKENA